MPQVELITNDTAQNVQQLDTASSQTNIVNYAEIYSALYAIEPDCGYTQWLSLGMALYTETGGSDQGLELWNQWSSRSSKYKSGEPEYKWRTFERGRDNPITIRTLYKYAYEAGWDGAYLCDEHGKQLIRSQYKDMMGNFTQRYAATMIEGKSAIIWREWRENLNMWTTQFSDYRNLNQYYSNVKVPSLGGNGQVKDAPIVDVWFRSTMRRTYKGVVFEPKPNMLATCDTLPDTEYYNLYQGLSITPQAGDCELILQHVYHVWCRQNRAVYDYVLDWLAAMFQKPGEQARSAIILKSGQGTGKNVIADIFVRAFGAHSTVCTKVKDLSGEFNDHLATAVFVFGNESIWGGNKDAEGGFKALITDDRMLVNRKYVPKFPVRNCTHLLMASNNDWVAPMDVDDRRLCVLDLDETRKNDPAYFGPLVEQINNGGEAAFLHFLLARDITKFNPAVIPSTGSVTRVDNKIRGANTVVQWLAHVLYDGSIVYEIEHKEEEITDDYRKTIEWVDEEVTICRTSTYSAYQQWCRKAGKHVESNNKVGVKLREVFPGLRNTRPRVSDSESTDDQNRPRQYVLPGLGQARRELEVHLNETIDWHDGGEHETGGK